MRIFRVSTVQTVCIFSLILPYIMISFVQRRIVLLITNYYSVEKITTGHFCQLLVKREIYIYDFKQVYMDEMSLV